MYPKVEVRTWADSFGSAEIGYSVDDNGDTVDFMFGSLQDYFEFGFNGQSLRRFVGLANEALRDMDTRQTEAGSSPS